MIEQKYFFGRKSKACLEQCHPDLRRIHELAIKSIPVDYGIHEAHRDRETQLAYFLDGKSRLDPRKPEHRKKSKHLRLPAEATDFHSSEKGTTWHRPTLSFIAGYLMCAADLLYNAGEIEHRLRWGGDWDMDGQISVDQSFDDFPHLELYKPQ